MSRSNTHTLTNWRMSQPGGQRIVFRPPMALFILRLALSFFCGVLYLGAWYVHDRAIDIAIDEKHATIDLVFTIVSVALGLLAVAGPLHALFSRLTVSVDGSGAIRVASIPPWPPARRWKLKRFDGVAMCAQQRIIRTKHRTVLATRWQWAVYLNPAGEHYLPPVKGAPRWAEAPNIPVFELSSSRARPPEGAPPPSPVEELARALATLTGLPLRAPVIAQPVIDEPGPGESFDGVKTFTKSFSFGNPQDVPPELLGRTRQQVRKGESSTLVHRSARITVKDANGRTQTYNSWDDVPQEIREKLKDHRPPRDT